MTAIWLRLQENYGYKGGYSSVRRFVHRLKPVEPEAFVRVHSEPGEDMQVDFGIGGAVVRSGDQAHADGLCVCGNAGIQPPPICRTGL